MKVYKPRSLRRELTRQMVIMQVLVLLVFTFMAALPILYLVSSDQVLDQHRSSATLPMKFDILFPSLFKTNIFSGNRA